MKKLLSVLFGLTLTLALPAWADGPIALLTGTAIKNQAGTANLAAGQIAFRTNDCNGHAINVYANVGAGSNLVPVYTATVTNGRFTTSLIKPKYTNSQFCYQIGVRDSTLNTTYFLPGYAAYAPSTDTVNFDTEPTTNRTPDYGQTPLGQATINPDGTVTVAVLNQAITAALAQQQQQAANLTFGPGVVQQLDPTQPPAVGVRNNGPNNYLLDFAIPSGATGPAGPQGASGSVGTPGPSGPSGPAGPAPSLVVGNVSTLPSGALAQANVRLVSGLTYAIDLGLPTGSSGGSNPGTGDPTFNPGFGGPYASGFSVTITNATQYCVSTTNTSCTPATPYTGPVPVSVSEAMCAVGASGNAICGSYSIGASTAPDSSITNIASPPIAQGYFSDGTIPFKQLYWGNSAYEPAGTDNCTSAVGQQCGVSGTPYGRPVMEFGLSTPNASGQPGYFGKPNSVAHYKFQSSTNNSEVSVLWTPKGGGLQAQSAAPNFYHDFWMMVKQGPATGDYQLEFDASAVDSGQKWMMGTQCDRSAGVIEEDGQNGWKQNGPHCTTSPHNLYDGKWHHLQFTYHRELKGQETGTCAAHLNAAGQPAPEATYWWDNVIFDGVTYPMNYSACSVASTWSQAIIQWQLGGPSPGASTSTPTTYEIYVDSDYFEAGVPPAATNPGGGGGSGGDLGSFNFDANTSLPAGLTATGAPTIVQTPTPVSSPNAAHFPSGLNYLVDTINPSTKTIYTGQSIYLESTNNTLPDAFLRFYNGNAMLFGYYFSTTSFISYVNNGVTPAATATAGTSAFPTGSWHCVETYTKFDATAGHVTVWYDNTQVYDSGAGTLNTGTTAPNGIWFGNIGNTAPTGWVTDQDNVNWDDTARPGCS